MEVTPTALKLLETRVNSEEQEQNDAEKERDEIAKNAGKVAGAQTIIKKLTDDLTKLGSQLETMQFQAAMNGDMSVLMDGSYAAKVADKKILFGLAGAMVGACVPVALLMLLGLMDTRFRYSDDAAGQGMAGIPLLGILPNLPDRLSDPAQASIAAHCVHQIRTMLQLNAMREGSTAFAVTSASSGDGKTSLSLALGLSFAASGSRTLLIDADLVGGGLTSRLGNNSAVGIVDALAGVGLEECVQPTDVADLSLLPIGGAQAHHAGSFSPPAVRKLLATIRKHYEVIIIDTGPVMGSIEATPIAASVDGVVLTVARGQSRPLVERAITHLTSIGAKVAGVVFNRAQHKDFEQSIGAISIRSAARSTANGTGHNGRGAADMGAVAKAVATSVRSE
ncbi:MAG: CpsD/CapB family tyrosine-protein kinase, partial [Tepidisphaeraceae bacterium]